MHFAKYRKILIYIITFLAYAWSGYGADMLRNLRDAVLSAETIFGEFFPNAITVARKFKDVHEVIDAAAEESCVFTCSGGATPKQNWNHKPQSNGCGTVGMEQIQEFFALSDITNCCNMHDKCYDTCNSDKDKCDLEFKRCLYKYCDTFGQTSVVKACRVAAKVFFSGITTLGCKPYLDAQEEACYCNDRWNKYNEPRKTAHAGSTGKEKKWVDRHPHRVRLIARDVMDENVSKNHGNGCTRNKKRTISGIPKLYRSTNPFILFYLRMQRKRPQKPIIEVARKAGKLWCQMSMNQRKKYILLAQAAKKRQEAKKNKRKCKRKC